MEKVTIPLTAGRKGTGGGQHSIYPSKGPTTATKNYHLPPFLPTTLIPSIFSDRCLFPKVFQTLYTFRSVPKTE